MAPKQKFWIPEKGQVFYNCTDGTPSFYTLKEDQPGAQGCVIPHICDSGQPVPFRCPPEGGMIAHEHSNNKLYLCHRPQPEVARCAPGLVFDHKDEVCTSSAAAWPSESVYLSELWCP
ncbi:uncharacterized protein LOC8028305 isoform X2 [Ixodes scapularis]|uniref:uncharacterized protein LOC8028305 isoform X2 n=1 Tax=Ixodes scapularis TaxID=6945 RepID=UPI001A9E1A71|nr:uncharacterized protein LOC8028305 isoform X2 [Ixodes scapularis]